MSELTEIIRSLPNGTRVVIIAATLPDGTTLNGVLPPSESDVADAEAMAEPSTRAPKPATSAGDQHVSDRLTLSLHPTPLEIARRIAAEDGERSHKPREWAAMLGISAREIIRAVDAGAVAHSIKEDGRDHGAHVVTAAAVVDLLATIDAVERRLQDPPTWWKDVRGGRAARVVSRRVRASA